jgi:carboxymethylenebutenolidase
MSRYIHLQTEHGALRAFTAAPTAPAWGGLVLLHEIFGVNRHIRAMAESWAAQGLRVIAPQLMDFVEPDVELDYDASGVERGRRLMAEVGFERCVAAAQAAADVIREDGLKPAALGYCIGGSIALLCCTRLGLPAVSYYGGRSMAFLQERPQAPLLLLFGERDALIPADAVAAQRAAFANAQVEMFPAGHGFNCDQRDDFHAPSAARALQVSREFLHQALA